MSKDTTATHAAFGSLYWRSSLNADTLVAANEWTSQAAAHDPCRSACGKPLRGATRPCQLAFSSRTASRSACSQRSQRSSSGPWKPLLALACRWSS